MFVLFLPCLLVSLPPELHVSNLKPPASLTCWVSIAVLFVASLPHSSFLSHPYHNRLRQMAIILEPDSVEVFSLLKEKRFHTSSLTHTPTQPLLFFYFSPHLLFFKTGLKVFHDSCQNSWFMFRVLDSQLIKAVHLQLWDVRMQQKLRLWHCVEVWLTFQEK